eukprot:gene26711-32277_t
MSWGEFRKFLQGQVEAIEAIYSQQTSSWLAEVTLLRSCSLEEGDDIPIHFMNSWAKEDLSISTVLNDYRSQAMVIGNAAVKLGLFVSTVKSVNFESSDFLSLTGEIQSQLQTLSNIWSYVLLAKLSYELQSYFLRSHRSLMVHFLDLANIMHNGGPKTSIESAAGMVLHLSEEVQKVPITHKAALRRFVMEKCLVVKETVGEFEGYLLEAAGKGDGNVLEDVEDGEDGYYDDGDERDYSAEEVVAVERCVCLMKQAQRLLKLLLAAATALGDSLQGAVEESERRTVFRVLAHCALLAYVLEGAVIDLGAELYPPLQDVQLGQAFQSLVDGGRKALRLLRTETLQRVLNEEQREMMEDIDGQLTPLS